LLALGRRVPSRVHLVVFGIGSADGGGKSQELCLVELSVGGLTLHLGVLGEGLRTDIGREELWMAVFEAKVLRHLVAEEIIRAADNLFVQGDHAVEILGRGRGRRPC